jgi:hypothetical protein
MTAAARPPKRIRVPLHALAHGRAGDKGNTLNVSVIARRPEAFSLLLAEVTEARVLEVFAPLGATRVTRYALPRLHALNFVVEETLGGGVNASLALDRHGKTLSFLLLGALRLEADPALLPEKSPYAPGAGG